MSSLLKKIILAVTIIVAALAGAGVGYYYGRKVPKTKVINGRVNMIVVSADGEVVAGTWLDGKRDGLFREIDSKGVSNFSLWKADTIVKQKVDVCVNKGYKYGIDISRYQSDQWGAMLIAENNSDAYRNIDFMLVNASGGDYIVDTLFDRNVSRATTLDIPLGAYHVFTSKYNASAQANTYLKVIKDIKLSFPPVLDIEGSSAEISREKFDSLVPEMKTWLSLVENETGHRPLIYCCEDLYKTYFMQSEFADKYKFWIARYTYSFDPLMPAGASIHQFSDKGRLYGWKSNVDLNIMTESEFGALLIK